MRRRARARWSVVGLLSAKSEENDPSHLSKSISSRRATTVLYLGRGVAVGVGHFSLSSNIYLCGRCNSSLGHRN